MPADLKPVLVVLPQGFADWETPLIAAASDFYGLPVRHATPGGGTVRSIGGLTVAGLDDLVVTGDEVIVLCGSNIWFTDDAPDLGDLLRAAADRGQTIAAICGATRALAGAGLLDGRAHTANEAASLADVAGYRGGNGYRDVPHAVADGGIITAPGAAPASFAAEVLLAAGLAADLVAEFRAMAGAEHHA